MKVRVRRAKDLPRILSISTSGYRREFPADQEEFILDVGDLPHVLHDGNMEFIQYIEEPGDENIIVKQP